MTRLSVSIDRGGTFTDCIALDSDTGTEWVVKLLSVDPDNYEDAPTEGIRRLLELATGTVLPRHAPLPTESLQSIRMATTVATNALLERKGERCALLITKGFSDALQIGTQARPHIFDLSIETLDVLYESVVEVDERFAFPLATSVAPANLTPQHRITPVGATAEGSHVEIPQGDARYKRGITGEWIKILKEPDLAILVPQLKSLKDSGIESLAICLLHSYTYPAHEEALAKLCKNMGFAHVTLSSHVMPMIKLVPRGNSAVADAYLTPCLQKYLNGFYEGFDAGISSRVQIEFMQSDGGLAPVKDFTGVRAILSGPAGGVVGYAKTSWESGRGAVIGFDMGGTSTDVSRFDGRFEQVFETRMADVTIQAPQLDIQTVASGGGSRLFFRSGMFVTGPESVGANPGPTCYRKGGHLAITDANLLLGRLIPDLFPKIFGPKENEALDLLGTQQKFKELAQEVNAFMSITSSGSSLTQLSVDEIAYGFIRVANETMCRPIRALTQAEI